MNIDFDRHARLYAGHPRLESLAAPKGVDGRDKPGHDAERHPVATLV
jgi:hypothetical protein